ncbi:CopG family transcriptional regulator [candidate division KSB1 bacterium]|nr:CopG family transcriptional regulator [candidate division KSB1 bacterium]NIR73263.1 CopG family transcriptional regulator [candidate division KSB1 bacterium]NIS26969.1 CopG family transcriptional regulator [candidate division KSB1 bacterium]NIT73808.1 CopG family transcriptional regulator [candidate division KSB1 bacterium]NIU27713.1 CopG family transcriptional regulator [candidate division KSB1 bacterium]
MNNKINYSDEPMEDVKVIPDFLPPPEELAFKEETVKVTIALSKRSVDFFKRQAKHHTTRYQRLIRRLLDEYVSRQASR